MHANEISDLVAGASTLFERIERRSAGIERQLQDSKQQLHHVIQQVPALVRQAADEQIQRIPAAITAKIESGLQQPVHAYEKRLQDASRQLQQASHALAEQLQKMQALHRHLIWKIAGVALASLALVVICGGWLLAHYYDEIRRNQIAAELLKAYNAADVTLCDERLCANVETKGAKYGEKNQYRPVRDRH